MNVTKKLVLLAFVLLLPACAQTNLEMSSNLPGVKFEAEFPAVWVKQVIFAYDDFNRTKKDMTCYGLLMGKSEDGFSISFFQPLIIEPSSIEEREFDDEVLLKAYRAGECSSGAVYKFDKNGNFLDKVYIR